MPAFVKIGSIEGEATDQGHSKWIIVESVSAPIHRSIPQGAKDQQRTKGETTLGDIVLVRNLDKSTPKLMEACANGTFYPDVTVEMCSTIKSKQAPYMQYKLSNVIVTSHSFHGSASGMPLPSEEVTLGFTEAKWTYTVLDPTTGGNNGQAVGSYTPGSGQSS